MPTKKTTRKRGRPKKVLQVPLAPKIAEAEIKAAAKPENDPTKDITIGSPPPEAEAQAATSKAGATTPKEGTPRQLPKHLQDQIDALNKVYAKVQDEVDAFKKDDAYLAGDVPVTLHGLQGPGFQPGQRVINYIDVDWLDPNKHFRWSNKRMVDYHRGNNFAPEDFDAFTTMVKARGGGHTFTKTAEGHVACGDLIMVSTSEDWYQHVKARNQRLVEQRESRSKAKLEQQGDKYGCEVYEGSEAKQSDRMQRLIEFLDKELGPGASQAYLGG